MSHEDAVVKLPKNFRRIASTKNSKLTIIENENKKIYGVQFSSRGYSYGKWKTNFQKFSIFNL